MGNDAMPAIAILQVTVGVVIAVATATLAIFGVYQLRQIAHALSLQGEREKKWATIKACERYDSDPAINQYAKAILSNSNGGIDYTHAEKILQDVIGFMNYLDGLAIGIFQGVYHEQIVYDHMWSTIYKAVLVFIKGESGDVDGIPWKAGRPLLKPEGFPGLTQLFEKWFKDSQES